MLNLIFKSSASDGNVSLINILSKKHNKDKKTQKPIVDVKTGALMNGSSIFVSVGKSKEKGRINKNVIQFLEREGSKREGCMLRVTSDATYTKNYSSIFEIESKSHKAKDMTRKNARWAHVTVPYAI